MLRYFPIIIISGFLFSCSPEPSQSQTDSPPEETNTDKIIPAQSGSLNYDQAIIVTSGVRARSGPSINDGIIRSFEFGEIVTLKDSTSERVVVTSGESCDEYGYRWYKIEDNDEKESWVFGKFLYQVIAENSKYKPIHSMNQVGEQDWIFGAAVELSYGPSNQDGLTGCDVMYLPFFYQKGDKIISSIIYDPTIVRSPDLERYTDIFSESALLLTQASDGGSIVITDLYVSNEENIDLKMEIKLYYQDGDSDGIISLRKYNQGFQIVNFSKTNNQ